MTISRQQQKRKTPPRGMAPMKKLPGSMPKMPTLEQQRLSDAKASPSVAQRPRRGIASGGTSTAQTAEDGDDDDDEEETAGEKEDERRMAEIIIKLQLAKQQAAESKKRKQDEAAFAAQRQQLEKDNAATINSIKRARVSELKKIADRRNAVVSKLTSELARLKQLRSEHTRRVRSSAEELRSMQTSLASLLSALEGKEAEVKDVFANDFSVAKQEVGRKLEQLREAVRRLEGGGSKSTDKFASIIEAIVKSFE